MTVTVLTELLSRNDAVVLAEGPDSIEALTAAPALVSRTLASCLSVEVSNRKINI